MSCLVKIRALKEQLSPNEKKIARFILDNPALIRDYSSQNLAASVGVSQSSVVKFSQKLGYKGFIDLKLAIHEAVLRGGSAGDEADSGIAEHARSGSSMEELFRIKSQALQSTLELNEEERLLEAARVLDESERIQIVALGSGSLVARNFATVLIQIGKSVVAEVDTYIQLSSVATLGKGDTIFVISFSGESPRMLQIVSQAKKAGVTIITLTGYSANPIRSLADVELYCVRRLGNFEIPQIISTTSQQFVVDLLFNEILLRDRTARELMQLSRQAVENI